VEQVDRSLTSLRLMPHELWLLTLSFGCLQAKPLDYELGHKTRFVMAA